MGSVPGQGTKILHAAWCGQEKRFLLLQYNLVVLGLLLQRFLFYGKPRSHSTVSCILTGWRSPSEESTSSVPLNCQPQTL